MNLLTASQSEKKLLDVTGIEPVTRCLQNSPTSSCKPVGHSPMTTTLEVYKHASGDTQRQAVNQVENQLFPIVLGLGQLAGMNPCYETKNRAHMQIFIQSSSHLVAGEGVWGRGRRLSPLPQLAQ